MLNAAVLYIHIYHIILYRSERDDNQKTSTNSTILSGLGPYSVPYKCGKTYFPQSVTLSHFCRDGWLC